MMYQSVLCCFFFAAAAAAATDDDDDCSVDIDDGVYVLIAPHALSIRVSIDGRKDFNLNQRNKYKGNLRIHAAF